MRDVNSLAKAARRHGDAVGLCRTAARYRSLPWTKCGRSTGCSGSCAGTAQGRWMPRAPARWIRRRERRQDRLHAGEGDREHAPAAASRGVPGEEERRREAARICCLLALDTSTELRRLFPHRNWAPSCARSMDATAISARLAIRRVRLRRRLHRAGQLLHAQRAVDPADLPGIGDLADGEDPGGSGSRSIPRARWRRSPRRAWTSSARCAACISSRPAPNFSPSTPTARARPATAWVCGPKSTSPPCFLTQAKRSRKARCCRGIPAGRRLSM